MDSKVIRESGNNYIKFGNNCYFQWGTKTTSSTVSFPKPFSTTPSICIGDVYGGTIGDKSTIINQTATNFSFGQKSYPFNWIAIGI